MTPKELKRLSRSDLLEMLLELSKENERLLQEVEQLRIEVEQRKISIEKCGSMAEAALSLNGVFEAAQSACEQYMENIRQRCEQMEQETKEKCDKMLKEISSEQINGSIPEEETKVNVYEE